MNPRGVFRHPTPLAGEPLRPLGYFCKPLRYTIIAEDGLSSINCDRNGQPYFPTQKREKMRSVTSSRTLRPLSSPSAASASSRPVNTASGM